jgi:hypothetical protein
MASILLIILACEEIPGGLTITTRIFKVSLLIIPIVFLFQNCDGGGADLSQLQEESVGRTPNNLFDDVVYDVNLPLQLEADNADGIELMGISTVEMDAVVGQSFSVTTSSPFFSSAVFRVDPSRTYTVSGQFRSAGATDSVFYFGLALYDANGRLIPSAEASRRGNIANTIVSVTPTQITTSASVDTWLDGGVGRRRYIGLYFDGNVIKKPDYIHYVSSSTGAYSTAAGTTVNLTGALPSNVISQISSSTVILNHFSGSSYNYVAALRETVPATWTTYSGQITGLGFNSQTLFRFGAVYARLMVIPNYQQQADDTELRFTNLRVTVQ